MRSAFLLEPPKFDISTLYEKYKVEMIFDDSHDARQFVSQPGELMGTVCRWAEERFNPDTDYFVLTGNQALLVVCAMALQATYPCKRINFLRYDSRTDNYGEFGVDGRSESTCPEKLSRIAAAASRDVSKPH